MVHLHVHSEYSLRDSIIRISDLVSRVKEYGQSAVALTDHGNMSGAFEFYMECLKQGIKPIIGIELYVVPDMVIKDKGEKRYHLVLLAFNREGYQNLLRISSIAGTDGFYYVPRADFAVLKKNRKGLIALTGCISSVLYMLDGESGAIRILRLLKNMYRYVYLEVMPHNMKEQKRHNLMVENVSSVTKTPVVLTKDCHFLDIDSKEAHDILMKIQGREPYTVDLSLSEEREIWDTWMSHSYLSSSVIMAAMHNADIIAAMVQDYDLPVDKFEYPEFDSGGVK